MLYHEQKAKSAKHNLLGLNRNRLIVTDRDGVYVKIQGKRLINFTSSDYLNVSKDPEVKSALARAINEFGMGSTASALISGFYDIHHSLETKLAQFFSRERALLFNSGYMANVGVMTAFANRHSRVVADKHCHASLLDGIRLSRAHLHRYAHRNYQEAQTMLSQHQSSSLLVSEGVFSMDGSIADAHQLAKIAASTQALFVLDDAHGAGVMGVTGGGVCEHYHLDHKAVPLLVVPLGKAFGAMGAVVLGSRVLIDYIMQFAGTYRYTTAIPPHLAAGIIASLEIIARDSCRRDQLKANIAAFVTLAKSYDLPLMDDAPTPIKTIWVGDSKRTLALQKKLMAKGYFVSCIRPPTVKAGSARLRISITSQHEPKHLLGLVTSICEFLNDNL